MLAMSAMCNARLVAAPTAARRIVARATPGEECTTRLP